LEGRKETAAKGMKRKRTATFSSWIGSCLSPLFRIVAETVGADAIPLEVPGSLVPPAFSSDGKDSQHKRRKVTETRLDSTAEKETDVELGQTSLTNEQTSPEIQAEPDPHPSATDHILYHELHADEFDPLG